jgi:hypothetical protein
MMLSGVVVRLAAKRINLVHSLARLRLFPLQLANSIHDPLPDPTADSVTVVQCFVGANGGFNTSVFAIHRPHLLGSTPNVDVGDIRHLGYPHPGARDGILLPQI